MESNHGKGRGRRSHFRALDRRPGTGSRESVQVRQILALTYPEGPTISVKLQGTSRLPLASGEAKVERKKGMTEIEIELDELKPATAFGGDYNTYVLSARGLVVSLPNILFESGRADLKPEGREALAKISGVLLIANGFRLSIEGHTDNVGSPDFNLDLSRRRAESVRAYLLGQGLSPAAMQALGFGESRPVASNETNTGRQENRRVEIVVLDSDVGQTPQ